MALSPRLLFISSKRKEARSGSTHVNAELILFMDDFLYKLSGIEKKAKGGTHLGAYVSKDLLSLGRAVFPAYVSRDLLSLGQCLSGEFFLLNENHDYNLMTICEWRVRPSLIESCAMIKRKI